MHNSKGNTKNPYRVLVAEDDPFQRLSLIDILQLSNFDPVPVEDGSEALKYLKNPSYHFDLVLLDLIMPIMTGKDVLEEMMKDERLRDIPVVVMSAQDDKTIIASCLDLGAKDFIVKPLRECRGLELYVKTGKRVETEKSISKFKTIKSLGAGTAGQVDLVEHMETKELRALKTI